MTAELQTATPETSAERARTLLRLNTAYWQAKVLHSAVEIGLFEFLAQGPATVEEIRSGVEITHSLAMEYLDILVHLGLLERSVDELYSNSDWASEFLVPTAAQYMGGTITQHSRMHYHTWSKLTEALRDGQAKSGMTAHGPDAYPTFYQDLDKARQVMNHFDVFNGFTAEELAGHLDWSQYRSFVDVGGGRGNVAATIAAAHPHLQGGVFDLPALRPLYEELAAERGLAQRLQFHGGDFFANDLPKTDVVIIGHVLPDWPVDQRQDLVNRIFNALDSGGMIVIYDTMIGADHEELPALLQRLNHSLVRGESSSYTVQECRGYLEEAGFHFDRAHPADTLVHDWFVTGIKP